jgi:DNA-binding Lrp family transcriptional regulator
MNIDRIDRELINLLEMDASQTSYQLSQKLMLSPSAVRHRKNILIREGIIKNVIWVNDERIGYPLAVQIGIRLDQSEINTTYQELLKLPEVKNAAVVTGNFDIIILVHLSTFGELLNFVQNKVSRIKGVINCANFIFLKASGKTIPHFENTHAEEINSRNIDEKDIQLARFLETQPEQISSRMTRQLDLSPGAIRHRKRELIRKGIIKKVIWINEEKIGYPVAADIGLSVDQSALDSVYQALLKLPAVKNAAIVSGNFDILILVRLTSVENLLEFIQDVVLTIPGVIRCDSHIILRTKR